MNPEDKKKIISDALINKIEEHGLLNTIQMIGGYKNFDRILPDYFYHGGSIDRDHMIDFLNQCVELNYKREGEEIIYLYEYGEDILYQEWGGEGDEQNKFFSYESRIISFGVDIAFIEVFQYDDEGNMFDDSYDYENIPLNRLEGRFLSRIFERIWGGFKL